MTCVAFSIKFAKTNQKFAENPEFYFVKIIHDFSKLFTSLLNEVAITALKTSPEALQDLRPRWNDAGFLLVAAGLAPAVREAALRVAESEATFLKSSIQ